MERVRSVSDWLRPTFVGTLLGAWAIAFIDAVVWDELGSLPENLARATVRAVLLGLAYVAVDVVLVQRGWRELPLRTRAFWMSFTGPILASVFYIFGPWDGPLSVFVLGGKLLLTAVTVRLLFGRLPHSVVRRSSASAL